MTPEAAYTEALGRLRIAMLNLAPGEQTYEEIVKTRDQVFARYRPVFSLDHVPTISREEFTSFLYSENNHHWSGLYRKGLQAAEDMDALRRALTLLLDESKPMQQRFTGALDMVKGLGKATATGILTVAHPESYGVWNNTSEAALRNLGLWPTSERGEKSGATYTKVNALLARLRNDLETDFWTLDAVWWYLSASGGPPITLSDASVSVAETQGGFGSPFALEKQLENFLLENWEHTPLGAEWAIYGTDDEPEAGDQFPTDVGPVDILAVHKTDPKMLVIELKRGQSTDQTVGQVLRYMGWIDRNLARPAGKSVEGLIIAHELDKSTSYALQTISHVRFLRYEIEFRLTEPPLLFS